MCKNVKIIKTINFLESYQMFVGSGGGMGAAGELCDKQGEVEDLKAKRVIIPAEVGMSEAFFAKLKNIIAQQGYQTSK